MTGRRDYYHDPAANSLGPGGSTLIVDDQARVLLHRRADSVSWALPGGMREPDMEPTARRHVASSSRGRDRAVRARSVVEVIR
jgi:8-oxo-dGTP pyrophosphatase MutT (NUDIX family)